MYKESVRRPLENDLGPQCSSTLYLFADLFNYYIRPISPEPLFKIIEPRNTSGV